MVTIFIDDARKDQAISLVLVNLGVLDRDCTIEAKHTDAESLVVHRGRVVEGH